MPNQIMAIAPYWLVRVQTWVFDDRDVGLKQEPFVSGAPEIINLLVRGIPKARKGFRLLFSAAPFPGFQMRLLWLKEEAGGNWYRLDGTTMEGWLCPAMFHYFHTAPKEIYAKAERLKVAKQ